MHFYQEYIEKLLPGYFQGTLTEEEINTIDAWKDFSPSNLEIFNQTAKVWHSFILLNEMQQYYPEIALQKINARLNTDFRQRGWRIWQQIAAILVVPLLISAIWLSLIKPEKMFVTDMPVWNTFTTPPGVKSMFYLPDSTAVWLNSSSSIRFPSNFADDVRMVEVKGEVFFDVRKNPEKQFIVKMGILHTRVHGTSFIVIDYENEDSSEIILVSGSIEVCSGSCEKPRSLSLLKPGERACFDKSDNSLNIHSVDTEKYVSWINGTLIFRDDPMSEVIQKLNRWFNVKFEVSDPEIFDYVYTATFTDESIDQILELLTISAPLRYQVVQREKQANGTFSPKRILLYIRK